MTGKNSIVVAKLLMWLLFTDYGEVLIQLNANAGWVTNKTSVECVRVDFSFEKSISNAFYLR